MPLLASSARLGAALGIIGAVLLLWTVFSMFSVFSYPIGNLLSHPERVSILLLILVLLGINGVALVSRLPTWLAVLRLVMLAGGLLLVLVGFFWGLSLILAWGQGRRSSLGYFFRGPLKYLAACLGGLLLNFVGVFLSH